MDMNTIEHNVLSEIKRFADKSNDFYVLGPNNGVPEQVTKIVMEVLKHNSEGKE